MRTLTDSPYSISVVIPAYNIEKYIARAIDSVLQQTQPPNEIIVVDDGSTDSTAKIIQDYKPNIRYIYQDNAGVSAACNTGIRAANYKWIAFLDADDTWLPKKLEQQLALLQRNKHLRWTTCNYISQSSGTEKSHEFVEKKTGEELLNGKAYIDSCFRAVMFDIGKNRCSMLIKKEVLQQAGLFQNELHYGEDLDLWWRIGYSWPEIGYVNEPLAIYHTGREGSLTASTSSRKILRTGSNIFSKHLELSAQYGKQKDIKPFMIKWLKKWLTINYRQKEFDLVRKTLRRHRNLFPVGYYTILLALSSMPTITVCFGNKLLELLNYNKT